MDFLIYFLLFIIFAIVFLAFWFVGYFLIGIFNKRLEAPYVSSFGRDISLMQQFLHLDKGKTLVDLGCGDGKALRFFVKHFGIKGFGYDINVFAIFLGRLINRRLGFRRSISLSKKDFMDVDLSKFDYIYVYLLPNQMLYIEDWIWKNVRSDAVVISNTFQFKKKRPFETIKNKKGKDCIFLYRKI